MTVPLKIQPPSPPASLCVLCAGIDPLCERCGGSGDDEHAYEQLRLWLRHEAEEARRFRRNGDLIFYAGVLLFVAAMVWSVLR